MISTLRSQVGFAAAVARARLRLSRLERAQQPTAGRYASAARMAARAFISPTAFEQARGRRSGSGRWQGRVRRGRSLRSRPRNSVHRSVRPRVRSAPGANVGRDGCEVRLCRSVGSDPSVRVSRLSRLCSLLTCLTCRRRPTGTRRGSQLVHTPHADAHPSTRRIAHFHRPGHRRRSH